MTSSHTALCPVSRAELSSASPAAYRGGLAHAVRSEARTGVCASLGKKECKLSRECFLF